MKRNYNLFLKDILDCINRIEEFVGNMGFEEFAKDDKTSSAVVKKLENIGEAVKNISSEIKDNIKIFPGKKWQKCMTK